MELKLDRDLADRRIFPAIDPVASGTRNEDLLVDEQMRPFVFGLRRILAGMNNTERAAASFIKGLKAPTPIRSSWCVRPKSTATTSRRFRPKAARYIAIRTGNRAGVYAPALSLRRHSAIFSDLMTDKQQFSSHNPASSLAIGGSVSHNNF